MSIRDDLGTLLRSGASRRDINRFLAGFGAGLVTLPLVGRRAAAQFDNPTPDPDLSIFTWAGYELDGFMPQYYAAHDMIPTFTFFAEEEEAFQKLRNGYVADGAHPCTASTGRWRDAGLIEPLDTSRIKHWDDIFPSLKTIRGIQLDGEIFMMPWDWGNSSILYRTDMVDVEEESFALLTDSRYAGRMAMYDSVDAMTAASGLIAGVANPFDPSEADMAAMNAVMRSIHANMLYYWGDQTFAEQGLASGELVASWAWNDAARNLKRQGLPVKFMNPKEGILTWVCGVVKLANGTGSEDRFYEFLSSMASPESGAYLIEKYAYGHANRKSFDLVDPELIAALGLGEADSFLTDGVFYEEIPAAKREKLIVMFDDVKSGA